MNIPTATETADSRCSDSNHLSSFAPSLSQSLPPELSELVPPGGIAKLSPRKNKILELANTALAGIRLLKSSSSQSTALREYLSKEELIPRYARELMGEALLCPDPGQLLFFFKSIEPDTLRKGLQELLNHLRKSSNFFGSLEETGLADELCSLRINGKVISDSVVQNIWSSLLSNGSLPEEFLTEQKKRIKVPALPLHIEPDNLTMGILWGFLALSRFALFFVTHAASSLVLGIVWLGLSALRIFGLSKPKLNSPPGYVRIARRFNGLKGAPCLEYESADSAERFTRVEFLEEEQRVEDQTIARIAELAKHNYAENLSGVEKKAQASDDLDDAERLQKGEPLPQQGICSALGLGEEEAGIALSGLGALEELARRMARRNAQKQALAQFRRINLPVD